MLGFTLIGFALMDFIVIFAFYVRSRAYTKSASSTFVILGLFFQGCMYALVPILATAGALGGEAERLSSAHEEKRLHEGEGQTNGNQVSSNQVNGNEV